MTSIVTHPINYRVRGFTLIEVLIAFVVLTIGLLGAVALQAKAKQSSYDAAQRSAAVALANDIIERIRANDDPSIIAQYETTFSSSTTLSSAEGCLSHQCTPTQVAAYDIQQWVKAVRMADNTGALGNATICITPTAVSHKGAVIQDINVEVIVSWEGRQEMTQMAENAEKVCGVASNKRRMVVVDGYVYLRA